MLKSVTSIYFDPTSTALWYPLTCSCSPRFVGQCSILILESLLFFSLSLSPSLSLFLFLFPLSLSFFLFFYSSCSVAPKVLVASHGRVALLPPVRRSTGRFSTTPTRAGSTPRARLVVAAPSHFVTLLRSAQQYTSLARTAIIIIDYLDMMKYK